jgi:hypothetical protein
MCAIMVQTTAEVVNFKFDLTEINTLAYQLSVRLREKLVCMSLFYKSLLVQYSWI